MSKRLGEIMTRSVKTLREDQTLIEAMAFMREQGVRHIPVVDASEQLTGLVTDRDIKRATPSALLSNRQDWDETVRQTPLSRIMARKLITASPYTPLRTAVQQFVEEKVGCLPVLDSGRLVGIVTASDLMRELLHLLPNE